MATYKNDPELDSLDYYDDDDFSTLLTEADLVFLGIRADAIEACYGQTSHFMHRAVREIRSWRNSDFERQLDEARSDCEKMRLKCEHLMADYRAARAEIERMLPVYEAAVNAAKLTIKS